MESNAFNPGDEKCYVYFDTEFTGLHKDTSLISIGLVDYEGKSFYAEFNDYDSSQINPWIIDNVIKNLIYPKTNTEGDHWTVIGNRNEVALQLMCWLASFEEDGRCVQFVSDVCHYDFVLLIDLLWKDAVKIPSWISSVCVDINHDIALNIATDNPNLKNFIPAQQAFNVSREMFIESAGITIDGKKHNSLYDAKVIRAIHRYLLGY